MKTKPSILLILLLTATTVALAAKPNVVVLLADDLGYRDVGCYDGPVNTPTIDGLAAGGTRFSDFYSGCAVCSPYEGNPLNGPSPHSRGRVQLDQ